MREPTNRKGLRREMHGIECAEILASERPGLWTSPQWTLWTAILGTSAWSGSRSGRWSCWSGISCWCGPFSALQNLTYAKLSKTEVKAKLRDAMAHVKFVLDMCLRRYIE